MCGGWLQSKGLDIRLVHAVLVKMGLVEILPREISLKSAGLELSHAPFATTREDLKAVAHNLLKPQEHRVWTWFIVAILLSQ
jgi:hypothetical protein